VSADGNTAIVGGPGDNSGTGAAWVYTRSGGAWTQQGNKLVGTGAVSLRDGPANLETMSRHNDPSFPTPNSASVRAASLFACCSPALASSMILHAISSVT
jgi:hypothetical protein